MTNDDFKSFITAVFLSALVVLGVNYFFPQQTAENKTVIEETQTPVAEELPTENNIDTTDYAPIEDILKQDERLKISNGTIHGSIRLKGARFDEILLGKYKLTLDADSPDVELFSPAKTANPYYADYGWLSTDKSLALPNKDTLWTVEGNQELNQNTPITLTWNNGQGVKFSYVIRLLFKNQEGHVL